MDTNIEIKTKLFKEFTELMWKQLQKGAERYAFNKKREATDFICDVFGSDTFCLIQVMKHLFEYLNTKFMLALVKIANWAFLLFCKDYGEWKLNDEGEEV